MGMNTMKIVSLTNADLSMGLRLGGLKECYIIESPEQAAEKILELTQDPNIGILIIDDEIARLHHDLIDEIRSGKKTFPIIVEIRTSDRKGVAEGADPLTDLIKRAIGVDISADKDQGSQQPKI
jgi:V/A-type H+-transporting ATPase subunit F